MNGRFRLTPDRVYFIITPADGGQRWLVLRTMFGRAIVVFTCLERAEAFQERFSAVAPCRVTRVPGWSLLSGFRCSLAAGIRYVLVDPDADTQTTKIYILPRLLDVQRS